MREHDAALQPPRFEMLRVAPKRLSQRAAALLPGVGLMPCGLVVAGSVKRHFTVSVSRRADAWIFALRAVAGKLELQDP
jgi:hypothetical protein